MSDRLKRIEQLQQENQALRKDLEHLKKAEIAFREIISLQDCLIDEQKAGLTRLRETLKASRDDISRLRSGNGDPVDRLFETYITRLDAALK